MNGSDGGQDDLEPNVQPLRSHGERGAAINRRHVAHAGVGGDDDRPERAHDDDKQHRGFGLAEPEERERHPANARQGLQAERGRADGVAQNVPARSEQTERQAADDAHEIADEQTAHRGHRRVPERPVARRLFQVFRDQQTVTAAEPATKFAGGKQGLPEQRAG